MTLVLVAAGGMVTSRGVGMAVPDWPNTYGYNMFFFPLSRWVGGIFYEHTHRLVASTVGLMTSIMAIWLFGRTARPFLRWAGVALISVAALTAAVAPSRWTDAVVSLAAGTAALVASFFWPRSQPAPSWLRKLGLTAFFAVVLQGVLGGLRVVLFKDQIGIFHAALAQLFFALICSLAVVTSRRWAGRLEHGEEGTGTSVRGNTGKGTGVISCGGVVPVLLRTKVAGPSWLFVLTSGLILLQLVLGATMRHQHAGLAIPDFPLAYGNFWPATDAVSIERYNRDRLEVVAAKPITAFQIRLQMLHRLAAVGILAAVSCCAWRLRHAHSSQKLLKMLAFAWLAMVLVQVLLGAATIWSNKAADLATAHVVVGALLLALGAISSMVSLRDSVFAGQTLIPRAVPEAIPPAPLNPRPAAAGT